MSEQVIDSCALPIASLLRLVVALHGGMLALGLHQLRIQCLQLGLEVLLIDGCTIVITFLYEIVDGRHQVPLL